jgi:hypothetical protein
MSPTAKKAKSHVARPVAQLATANAKAAKAASKPATRPAAKVLPKPAMKALPKVATKPVQKSAAAEPAKAVVAPKAKEKHKAKEKRTKGTFSMPRSDYALIDELKQLARKHGRPVKKNELLRAGLQALKAMDALSLRAAIARVQPAEAVTTDP